MTAILAKAPAFGRDRFLAFVDTRPDDEKWELIDGEAVGQARPTFVHAIIAGNVDRLLNQGLEKLGSSWISLQNSMVDLTGSSRGNMYVPDVMVVDGEGIEPLQNTTDVCLMAVEVVSPSDERRLRHGNARKIDVKLDRYRGFEVCRIVLILRQDRMEAQLYLRLEHGWTEQHLTDPDGELHIPPVGLRCRLRDVYARTPLTRRPG